MAEIKPRYHVILPKPSKKIFNNTELIPKDRVKRLELKRIRNRISAVKSRNNSKMRTLKMIEENNTLKKKISELNEEIEYLKNSNNLYGNFFSNDVNESEILFDDIFDDLEILCKDE